MSVGVKEIRCQLLTQSKKKYLSLISLLLFFSVFYMKYNYNIMN